MIFLQGVLLPSLIHKVEILSSSAKFVLIVEKDATFQHLLEEKAVEKLGPCIIITVRVFSSVHVGCGSMSGWLNPQTTPIPARLTSKFRVA